LSTEVQTLSREQLEAIAMLLMERYPVWSEKSK
jgi:hypothetical protein